MGQNAIVENPRLNVGDNYSKIIKAGDYDTLMGLHLYIDSANQYIANYIRDNFQETDIDVIDIGCGTGRVSNRIANTNPDVNVYGIDVDKNFLEYAKQHTNSRIKYFNAGVLDYKHPRPAHVISSGGFHHHIDKNCVVDYLKKIYEDLHLGGVYLVCDEFLPDYLYSRDDMYLATRSRDEALVIWYSHIIGSAIKGSEKKQNSDLFYYLAVEESKTLLDDIYQARPTGHEKTKEEIDLVMDTAPKIQKHIQEKNLELAKQEAHNFLNNLDQLCPETSNDVDETITLSRGDFKVSCSIFEEEAKQAGFTVEKFKAFGLNPEKVGCLGVYALRK